MLSQYIFNKTLYKDFKKELIQSNVIEKSVWIWKNENDKINIKFVINNRIYFIIKEVNKDIDIQFLNLPNQIDKSFPLSIKELKSTILDLKQEGSIVDSQHLIEFISNHLKNSGNYYGLSRKEAEKLYEIVVVDNPSIFKNNPPATVIDHITNKWID